MGNKELINVGLRFFLRFFHKEGQILARDDQINVCGKILRE